jgi:hypothetical protein
MLLTQQRYPEKAEGCQRSSILRSHYFQSHALSCDDTLGIKVQFPASLHPVDGLAQWPKSR